MPKRSLPPLTLTTRRSARLAAEVIQAAQAPQAVPEQETKEEREKREVYEAAYILWQSKIFRRLDSARVITNLG